MFVLASTYDREVMNHLQLKTKYAALLDEWNTVVDRINAKGCEGFLESTGSSQFDTREIKQLIRCASLTKFRVSALVNVTIRR